MRTFLTLILTAAFAAACAAPSEATSAVASPAVAGPPVASPPPVPEATPTELGGLPEDPAPSFSPTELELLQGLRVDAQVDCAPAREGLPSGAVAGVECEVGSSLVARVGAYRFPKEELAALAYTQRLADYGVDLRSGDCIDGRPGDAAWIPGDGPEEGIDVPYRSGCFVNEHGLANVRLTCPMPTIAAESGNYIGILGTTGDLAALFEWAWQYPEGAEMEVPTPPGICYNDSLAGPDL
jgi:hypothetical protein